MGWQRHTGRAGRPADEGGFTLIELMVALTVLTIGIFGTMGVFISALSTTATNDARTTATAISTREVENLRAAAYDNVGFTSSAPGFVATITEASTVYDTVVVAAPAMTPTAPDETNKGITFHIRRDIVWMSTTYAPHSWKRLISTVTWADTQTSHTVREDGGVYPGGLGPINGVTTTTVGAPSSPDPATNFTATVNSTNPTTQIDLAWNVGAVLPTYWEIQRSADGGATWYSLTATQPATALAYAASGLSSGTTYSFQIRGIRGTQNSSWTSVSATTQTPPPTCVYGAASIAPNPDSKKPGNTLQNDLNVSLNTSGTCGSLYVLYPVSGTQFVMTKVGTTYTNSLDKNAFNNWSTGNKTIYVKDASNVTVATISLLVN